MSNKPSVMQRIIDMYGRVSRRTPIRNPVVLLGLQEAVGLIVEMEERDSLMLHGYRRPFMQDERYRRAEIEHRIDLMKYGQYEVQLYSGTAKIKLLEDHKSFMAIEVEDPNGDREPPRHIPERCLDPYAPFKPFPKMSFDDDN